MMRARSWYPCFLVVLGATTGCDCKAVEHEATSNQVDTTEIASAGGNCVVHVYQTQQKLDSVGPKP